MPNKLSIDHTSKRPHHLLRNASRNTQCHTALLGSVRPCSVIMHPWLQEVPWPPWLCSITMEHWFHVASQCHMRPFSGTMSFWFHEVSQCHNGLFGCAVSQGTIGSMRPHSVKMDFGSMSSRSVKRPLCSWRFRSVTVDSLVPAITKSPKCQSKNP